MTTSKKTVEEIDGLVELHIDLSARVGAALGGLSPWPYRDDPVLPRVQVAAGGDENSQLLRLSRLVLDYYDRSGTPADLAMLTLQVAVGEAIGESLLAGRS